MNWRSVAQGVLFSEPFGVAEPFLAQRERIFPGFRGVPWYRERNITALLDCGVGSNQVRAARESRGSGGVK